MLRLSPRGIDPSCSARLTAITVTPVRLRNPERRAKTSVAGTDMAFVESQTRRLSTTYLRRCRQAAIFTFAGSKPQSTAKMSVRSVLKGQESALVQSLGGSLDSQMYRYVSSPSSSRLVSGRGGLHTTFCRIFPQRSATLRVSPGRCFIGTSPLILVRNLA